MINSRKTSIDPINIDNWRWKPFLEITVKALSKFKVESFPIPPEFLDRKIIYELNSKKIEIKANTWACSTSKFYQVRCACIDAGPLASVMNLVITPLPCFDLPFFGADFVTLPSGHLLALDLQPAIKDDKLHTKDVWEKLIPIHQKWKALFPYGGKIPNEAEKFFSPGFLWSRLPLNNNSDDIIDKILIPAFEDYINLYIEIVIQSEKVNQYRQDLILDGQRSYMQYRAKKDPARGMLSRFFGKEWTESYIHEVLFKL